MSKSKRGVSAPWAETDEGKCDRCGAREPAPIRVAVFGEGGQFVRADYCCAACVMVDADKQKAAAVAQAHASVRAILDKP